MSKVAAMFLLFLSLAMGACSARRGMPYTQPILAQEKGVLEGKMLYDRYCNSCHPQGTSGLGPAINNKPLPGFMIRFQIRHGVGVMPAFKREVISREESKKIVAYLKELRRLD
ncbi:c-type cytochrome [Cesiribacter andamanensis]|uniref:p-cresol methylhydroxylase cytochrome subunit n=1 Tax=Cesiribacter andamanensis AMV16 TaxID=1279009 RepID=M7N5T0_9BACT|nr:cytochrome c [Cesiribacter andamanensis]EMR03988.1 P-cresol methylhydroxylase cytochrome subunit [Cesiribacter andamanensis AMV16]